MKLLKEMAIVFFNLIDIYIHQKRIVNFLKKHSTEINSLIDVGAHKGVYTDLFNNNFIIKEIYMFEPQKEIFKFLKSKYKKDKEISIYNNAVSNKNISQKIYINKHDLTSGLTQINKKNFYLNIKAKLFGGNINELINFIC